MYANISWWVWPVVLFSFTFIIGSIASLSGLGGGVLFVPLATAFSPFNIDFIRGAGLILALSTALFSAPHFIKAGLANLKIMIVITSVSTVTSIIGAIVGLWITSTLPQGQYYVLIALGGILFLIFGVMLTSKGVDFPKLEGIDAASMQSGLTGRWFEPTLRRIVEYRTTRLALGVICFSVVGFIAGMFGLGAGWAGVPVLNLVMGVPIKAAAATSMTIIAVNDGAAAWPYISSGGVLPLIVVPTVAGVSIGARVGAKMALRAKPAFIKYLVIVIMLVCALINIQKGLHGLGHF
jgi:uncharacterized membrane protein YfcA